MSKSNENELESALSEKKAEPLKMLVNEPLLATGDNGENNPPSQCHSASNNSSDKLDELTSLEREIAEMHHVEPPAPVVAQRVDASAAGCGAEADDIQHRDKIILEMQPASRNATPAVHEDGSLTRDGENTTPQEEEQEEDSLEHEDLIAVLKGIEPASSGKRKAAALAVPVDGADVVEGVTIEGEGEFQIMEIFDEDAGSEVEEKTPSEAKASNRAVANKVAHTSSGRPASSVLAKLTREEERAMAMEQMAGLQAHAERNRRRKQDVKQAQAETRDLVSSIGAEWSDDDTPATDVAKAAVVPAAEVPVSADEPPPKDDKKISTLEDLVGRRKPIVKITNVVVLKNAKQSKSNAAPKDESASQAKRVAEEVATVETHEPQGAAATVAQVNTGFRRTRIIKRKIIWDPDAPETQISYAQLVRGSSTKSKLAEATPVSQGTAAAVKRDVAAAGTKKVRPNTPKDNVKASLSPIPAANNNTKSESGTDETVSRSPATKRRAHTPVANGANSVNSCGKKKKVSSEIDRLMSDEGAINMLNALEHERHKLDAEAEGEKPQRLLMRGRCATSAEKTLKKEVVSPVVVAVKKESATSPTVVIKKKGTPKQKPSSMWDYVYQKQKVNEDSMIIRRRSNSSYSSSASVHRSSLDGPNTPKVAAAKTTKTPPPARSNAVATTPGPGVSKTTAKGKALVKPSGESASVTTAAKSAAIIPTESGKAPPASAPAKSFEFAKPESKSSNQKVPLRRNKDPTQTNPLASDIKKGAGVTKKRATPSPSAEEKTLTEKKAAPSMNASTKEAAPRADVVVRRFGKVAQITFSTYKAKLNFTFTVQLMNKLVETLDKLSTDSDCNAVLMITTAPHFCQGIDFSDLTATSVEKRKSAAVELAAAVKNYLRTLATFPKPLIAGVGGANAGLGVTQLPLFDVVVASDKGSYDTQYAKIGQVPEGFCIWNNLSKIRGTLRTKLFWLCEKLHATESALSGLVNKLTTPNKVNDDAFNLAKKIAAMPPESYRVMKKATIQNNLDAVVVQLDEEFDVIIKQWSSQECCDNFTRFLETGSF